MIAVSNMIGNSKVPIVMETAQILPAQRCLIPVEYGSCYVIDFKGRCVAEDDQLNDWCQEKEGVELFVTTHLKQFFDGSGQYSP
jgi:hypothetical protein